MTYPNGTTTKKSNQHIKQGWIDLAAAMQATLSKEGARGPVKVTIRLVAHDLDVVRWLPAQIERISPISISEGGCSIQESIALVGLLEME